MTTRESQNSSPLRNFNNFTEEIEKIRKVRLDDIRVLLVDDSLDNRRLFERVIAGAGAVVVLACNGMEAIQAVEAAKKNSTGSGREPFDVIVMDIRMPLLDGYQATRLLRAIGFINPIIALTAHNTPGEEERCLRAGCSHFLLKPVDRIDLLSKIFHVTVGENKLPNSGSFAVSI